MTARSLGNEQRVDLSSVCPVFKITTPRLTRKVHVGETQQIYLDHKGGSQIYLDHKGGSRPRRRLGRLKGTQRETLLKESHAAKLETHSASFTLAQPPQRYEITITITSHHNTSKVNEYT